jgi:hypothetical protein
MEKDDAIILLGTRNKKMRTVWRIVYVPSIKEYEYFENKDLVNFGAYLVYVTGNNRKFYTKDVARRVAIRLENQNETEHGVIEKKYDFTYFKDYYSNDEDREIPEIQGDLEEEPEENQITTEINSH